MILKTLKYVSINVPTTHYFVVFTIYVPRFVKRKTTLPLSIIEYLYNILDQAVCYKIHSYNISYRPMF